MEALVAVVIALLAALVVWLLFCAFTAIAMPRLPLGEPHPARDEEGALAAFSALEESDGPEVASACRTQLLRPQGPARGTIIVWHGFTNCPAQFAEVAEILCAEGYFVLVPRIPRHGNADTLTRGLKDLTAEELVAFGHRCVDVGAGLPGPLLVTGLSVGATMAVWAGVSRNEVERVVALAPLVEPKGVPTPVGRLIVRFGRVVPALWIWWDPRRKADLGESSHVYPGFPLRGLVPFLQVASSLFDRRTVATHRLKRAALITNPGDFAIRNDMARTMMMRAFVGHADAAVELTLKSELGWWHDFVDQHGPHHGDPEQIAELMLAAFGEGVVPDGVIAATNDLGTGSAS